MLEVVAIGALAWWGFTAPEGAAASVVLGIGLPGAAVVLWGLFAAPRARFPLPLAGVPAVKTVVLGGGARDGPPGGGRRPRRGAGGEHGLRGVLQAQLAIPAVFRRQNLRCTSLL
ncbi:YrdB family protein [Streptomyces sp. QL37]|uniref:YrdB family protein n=1 Tax=Streptomyces sp. QL37 TaxID=2093747 RepID=UPI0021CAF17D|nr:YrdB family protein [Streptomyces sp. QL37]